MSSLQIIFLVFIHVINYNNGVSQFTGLNEICQGQNKGIGTCLHLEQCPAAQTLIKNRGHPQLCGFEGKYPIVCCEEKENLITESNSSGEIAREKCAEYKISSITTTTSTTTTTTTTPAPGQAPGYPAIAGVDTFPLEFPHMAILGYGSDEDMHWLCGGSLISEKFVLTAAHCISSRHGTVRKVNLGVHRISWLTDYFIQKFNVKNTFIHPNYTFKQDYHDIALIELDQNANIQSGVKPACLHTTKALPSSSFTATGWGATELYGENSNILQKVFLKFVSYNNCSRYYKTQKKLSNGLDDETQICADGQTERADTCQGDSGGPLQLVETSQDLFTIVGITSFGIKCSLVPAVYTRVSYYIPWIESIVWNS